MNTINNAIIKRITTRIRNMPPDALQEVDDFVQFLFEKHAVKTKKKPKFQWAGGLKEMGTRYTSVELQHKASEWRIAEHETPD